MTHAAEQPAAQERAEPAPRAGMLRRLIQRGYLRVEDLSADGYARALRRHPEVAEQPAALDRLPQNATWEQAKAAYIADAPEQPAAQERAALPEQAPEPDAWQVRRREDGEWGPWETCSEQTAAICQGLQSRQVRKLYAALPEQAGEALIAKLESRAAHWKEAWLELHEELKARETAAGEQAGGALTAERERLVQMLNWHADAMVRGLVAVDTPNSLYEVLRSAAAILTTARAPVAGGALTPAQIASTVADEWLDDSGLYGLWTPGSTQAYFTLAVVNRCLTTARATPAADVRDAASVIRTAILGLPLDVWAPGGRARALAANPWPTGSESAGYV